MEDRWEYQVVEEPNPVALRERLTRVGREGWEATSLGYAGECRLLALLRRQVSTKLGLHDAETSEPKVTVCT
jgi:hypothetical protein